MGTPSPPSSPSSRSPLPEKPLIHYSRLELLQLYDSPLVPKQLVEMRPLSEWYGEYTDPPPTSSTSPSGGRHAALHNHAKALRNKDGSSSASSSVASNNPFTNFGRFGVDGGLELEPGAASAGGRRNAPPHLAMNGDKSAGKQSEREKYGISPPLAGSGSFMERRNGAGRGVEVRDRERERDREPKKEGRAEEGGWRSAGTSDRRPRPLTSRDQSSSYRDREPRDRDAPRDRDHARSSGRPSWMDDSEPSSASPSTPAWASSANDPSIQSSSAKGNAFTGLRQEDGMDSIQAFKARMKEMERLQNGGGKAEQKEEMTEKKPAVGDSGNDGPQVSVFEALLAPATSNTLPPPPGLGPQSQDPLGPKGQESAREGGGRASRFAKFFDGKAPPPSATPSSASSSHAQSPSQSSAQSPLSFQHQPPPQRSVFEGLMGAAPPKGGPEPTREDRESMNRLLGMLQISGSRGPEGPALPPASMPVSSSPLPPHASQQQQPQPQSRHRPTSSITSPEPGPQNGSRQGGGSRFAFSQPPSAPSPHQQAPLSSPLPSSSQSGPPPQQHPQHPQHHPMVSPPPQLPNGMARFASPQPPFPPPPPQGMHPSQSPPPFMQHGPPPPIMGSFPPPPPGYAPQYRGGPSPNFAGAGGPPFGYGGPGPQMGYGGPLPPSGPLPQGGQSGGGGAYLQGHGVPDLMALLNAGGGGQGRGMGAQQGQGQYR